MWALLETLGRSHRKGPQAPQPKPQSPADAIEVAAEIDKAVAKTAALIVLPLSFIYSTGPE
jgi:hypothetical protein